MVEDHNLKLLNGKYNLFKLNILISMSHVQYHTSIKGYTFIDLLGDFGGFQNSISLIFGSLMWYYSRVMYQSDKCNQFDVAVEPHADKIERFKEMSYKLLGGQGYSTREFKLDENHLHSLKDLSVSFKSANNARRIIWHNIKRTCCSSNTYCCRVRGKEVHF